MRMILVLVVLAGCQTNHERKWKQGRNYDMYSMGDFDGEIPDGWRDVHDLDGPPFVNVPTNDMALWPESFGDGEILIGPNAPVSGDGCTTFLRDFNAANHDDPRKAKASNAQPANFGGDPGCRMSFARDGKTGWLLIRTHRGRAVFVRCLGTLAGLDRACNDVMIALKPVPSLDL